MDTVIIREESGVSRINGMVCREMSSIEAVQESVEISHRSSLRAFCPYILCLSGFTSRFAYVRGANVLTGQRRLAVAEVTLINRKCRQQRQAVCR